MIGNGDNPLLSLSLSSLVSRRSISITIQNPRPENLVSLPSSVSPHFFLFFFLSRTMLFHLHSVFTSRAFHASRLFLFAQLSFFSCLLPLVYSFSTFYSLVPSLLFFVTLPSRPFPLFSRLSFANQTCWLFLSSFFFWLFWYFRAEINILEVMTKKCNLEDFYDYRGKIFMEKILFKRDSNDQIFFCSYIYWLDPMKNKYMCCLTWEEFWCKF